jgi:hypothetical protein
LLHLPTGRLAVSDPGYEFGPEPLDRDVPPALHRVELALRSWRSDDGVVTPPLLIAAVRVSLQPGAAARFAAVRSALRGEPLDVGVDSGLVSVFDRAALPGLAGAAILDALPGSGPEHVAGGPAAHIVSAPGGGGIFVCSAGMGDGAYRAWWGETTEGETVELIVDFGLLEHSIWRTVERPASVLLGSAAAVRLAFAGTSIELEPVPPASMGRPFTWTPVEHQVVFRRPAGPHWDFSLRDAAGGWVGGPGSAELVPGPWFEVFDRTQIERAAIIRVQVLEGTAPDEPLES